MTSNPDGVRLRQRIIPPQASMHDFTIARPSPLPPVLRFRESAGVSDMFWQWGQFLDHDIDLTPVVDPAEISDIGREHQEAVMLAPAR